MRYMSRGIFMISEDMILKNNKYGYRINVRHPEVQPMYNEFRKAHHIPIYAACSDAQRLEFEKWFISNPL